MFILLIDYYRLLDKVFPKSCIYRIGDDDFAVICENISQCDFLDQVRALKGQIRLAILRHVSDMYGMIMRKITSGWKPCV